MQLVSDKLKDFTTNEVITISHKEPAWIENAAAKKIISYKDYGFGVIGV